MIQQIEVYNRLNSMENITLANHTFNKHYSKLVSRSTGRLLFNDSDTSNHKLTEESKLCDTQVLNIIL